MAKINLSTLYQDIGKIVAGEKRVPEPIHDSFIKIYDWITAVGGQDDVADIDFVEDTSVRTVGFSQVDGTDNNFKDDNNLVIAPTITDKLSLVINKIWYQLTNVGTAAGQLAAGDHKHIIPYCRVSRNSNQTSVAASTDTAVTFNNEIADNDTMYDSGAADRVTIKTAGIYRIEGNITFPLTDTTYAKRAILKVGGNTVAQNGLTNWTGANEGYYPVVPVSTTVNLAANDYIQLMAYHEHTTTLTLTGSGDTFINLTVTYLGKYS